MGVPWNGGIERWKEKMRENVWGVGRRVGGGSYLWRLSKVKKKIDYTIVEGGV
jgi:hypothetical protein